MSFPLCLPGGEAFVAKGLVDKADTAKSHCKALAR